MNSLWKNFNQYRGMSRQIYILSFADIINRIGCFVNVFFALFLTQTLGLSPREAGLVISIYGISAILGTAAGGKLGDHIGRKTLLVWSKFISAFLIIGCGFLLHSKYVIGLLIIAGFLRGVDKPINNALIMDLTNTDNRKKAFSLLYLCDNFGFAIGSAAAGYLFRNYIQWIFFGDAITSLIAITLIFLYIPETLPSKQKEAGAEPQAKAHPPKESTFHLILKRPELLIFILVVVLDTLIYSQYSFSLPLYIKSIFKTSGEVYYGHLMSFNSIVVLLVTSLVFLFTKKHSPIVNIAIGSLLYGVGYGILYFLKANPLLMLAFGSTLIWTLGEIFNATNLNVFIADNSPADYRSRFSGFYHTFASVGKTISPSLFGLVITTFGMVFIWPAVFLLSILLSACALYILYLKAKSNKTTAPDQARKG